MVNSFFILYFRENNSSGEYVIFTEEDYTQEQIEEFEMFGYHFQSKIAVQTNDIIYDLPFESTLLKQY